MGKRYLTAKELGISSEIRKAMIWFKNRANAGDFRYTPDILIEKKTVKLPFNMDDWGFGGELPEKPGDYYCGTAHCIGGWLEVYMNKTMSNRDDRALYTMFYPHCIDNWSKIKPKHAAQVIDHYLKTGDIDWSVTGLKLDGKNLPYYVDISDDFDLNMVK